MMSAFVVTAAAEAQFCLCLSLGGVFSVSCLVVRLIVALSFSAALWHGHDEGRSCFVSYAPSGSLETREIRSGAWCRG